MGHSLLFIEASHSDSGKLQSVGLLWKSDQPVAETSTWQQTTITEDREPCSRRRFEPTVPAISPQNHALNRAAATGNGTWEYRP